MFPYLWYSVNPLTGVENPWGLVPGLHPLPCILLGVRNLAFLGLTILIGRNVLDAVADRGERGLTPSMGIS